MNKITVAIISSNNKYEYLKETISCAQKFDSDVFVLVNGADVKIEDFLKQTKDFYPKLIFETISDKIDKSSARNICVEKINADVIYFLDDDAFFTADNIKILNEKFNKFPIAGVIGGPNLTPENSSNFEKLSGIMLSTYFLSWKMSSRYAAFGKDRLTDDTELILCNLAVRKSFFQRYNLKFEKKLHYNEENLLLEQMKKCGVKFLYTPDLIVYHHRRSSLYQFLVQVFNSGKGRALMPFFMPSSLHFVYMFPAVFVLYIVWSIFFKTKFILLFIYLLLTINNIANAVYNNKLKFSDIPVMFLISISAHISYGSGFIAGLFNGALWKIKK